MSRAAGVPLNQVTAAVSPVRNPVADETAVAPIRSTLWGMFGTHRLPGLAPGLVVRDQDGWAPATTLTEGDHLPALLGAAQRRWQAAPHAAAALAWKAYTYSLALPPAVGWASARRVPLVSAADVLVHTADPARLLTLGLRPSIRIAVLPGDPLAVLGVRNVEVVPDEEALLAALRGALLDAHLTPLLEQIRAQVHVGARTLLGSLASGIAYGLLRASDVVPGSTVEAIGVLLGALDIADLVDLVPAPTGALTVQRRTCCLAFTLPQPRVCAGCCIRPVP